MIKELKFGRISDKLDNIIINGQATDPDCLDDCSRDYFTGNDGGIIWHGCTKHTIVDAHWTSWW